MLARDGDFVRRGYSPDLDSARSTFRALITRLGEAAGQGGADTHDVVGPFVEALLVLRARARDTRDWDMADLIRDQLTAAGVDVRDSAEGSAWVLATPPD
jgi:cysteinyl-tRNA synthetase